MAGDQLSLPLSSIDRHHARACAGRLIDACRDVCMLDGYEKIAADLDDIFGADGHPVSPSLLRAALNGAERTYWRGEWVVYFARRSPLVASIVREASAVPRTAEETLALLEQLGVEEYGASFRRMLKKLGRSSP